MMQNKTIQTLTKYFLLIAVVLVFIIFGLINPTFLKLTNIMVILKSVSVTAIMALGMMLIVNTGEIDFAIGSQMTLAGVIIGKLMDSPTPPSYFLAFMVALIVIEITQIIGITLRLKLSVPSFIATLGMSAICDAINTYFLSNTSLTSKLWPEVVTFIGRNYLFGVVPIVFVIMVVLSVIVYILMEKTVLGRNMYATGANVVAANQVGIRTNRLKFLCFLLAGIFITIAGSLQLSIDNCVTPLTGNNYCLPVVAATILGATFLTPGKYNVPGVFIATLFTSVIRIGVTSVGASSYATDLCQGLILIVAVAMIANIRSEGLPSVKFG